MQNKIRDVVNYKGNHVYTIEPESLVANAVEKMNHHKIGCLVAEKEGRLVGIFTERDVLSRVVANHLDPKHTWVVEVMTTGVATIDRSARVEEAMQLMTRSRCRHLPVLENGALCGLISIGDLTKWCLRNEQARVRDLERFITS